MVDFVRHNRVVLTCTFLLLTSLLLASLSGGRPSQRDPVAALVLDITSPFARLLTDAAAQLRATWESYVDLTGVAQENRLLRARLRAAEAGAVELAEARQEVRRLQKLLGLRRAVRGRTHAARVIARAPSPWFGGVIVDIGSRDGVRPGTAVVAPEGVVGQIAATGRRSALVLLLTDPRSGVDALVQRTRARGIVRGNGRGGSILRYVEEEDGVRPGDVVITSGLDGIFPKGLLIGTVTAVTREEQGLLVAAQVKPAANLQRLEEVLVVAQPPAETVAMTPPSGVHAPQRAD